MGFEVKVDFDAKSSSQCNFLHMRAHKTVLITHNLDDSFALSGC